MFLEVVRSEGLNHLSYVVGDKGQAAVIDPRRDCRIYVDIAVHHGAKISHIFETHRHEDFVIGSLELARRTRAKIFHGNSLVFKYGEIVRDGDRFTLGDFLFHVLETPGHTPDSISIALFEKDNDRARAVFSGDALLPGAVGCTCLFPALQKELSEKLYESIHKKILPLGDHVVLYPTHCKRAQCANQIDDREFSTIGYERLVNPALSRTRKEFISDRLAEEGCVSPHFRRIHKFNQDGIPLVAKLPEPVPESAALFADALARNNIIALDVRAPEAFAGAHIADSLSIPLEILSILGGWFLPSDRKIGIVADRDEQAAQARLYLMRMGYDNVTCYLAGGMNSWFLEGRPCVSLPVRAFLTQTLSARSDEAEPFLLDVRSRSEAEQEPVESQRRVWVGELPQHFINLPRDRKIVTYCGCGRRAVVAASLLKQAKFKDVEACLGTVSGKHGVAVGKKTKRAA